MRLVILDKQYIKVYEGRMEQNVPSCKLLVAFEITPLNKEEIEYVRTDVYQDKA